jgi:hypothetical protein
MFFNKIGSYDTVGKKSTQKPRKSAGLSAQPVSGKAVALFLLEKDRLGGYYP